MADAPSLDARIRRLEDIEAIKKLTATYAHFVDKGWNGKEVDFDRLPEVFTEDATWRSAAMGVDADGREGIIAMLRENTTLPFAMHSFTNPIIDIDGDRATGKWLLWVGVDMGQGGNEVFQSEDLVYVRVGGGWRIAAIDLHVGLMLNG